jgi:hypothetical protein
MQHQRTHIQLTTFYSIVKKSNCRIFFFLFTLNILLKFSPPALISSTHPCFCLSHAYFPCTTCISQRWDSQTIHVWIPCTKISAKEHIYSVRLTHLQGGLVLERLFSGDGTLHPVGAAVVQHLPHHGELEAAHRADVGLQIIICTRTNKEVSSRPAGPGQRSIIWSLAAGGIVNPNARNQ